MVIDPCRELCKACVVAASAARLLKTTIGLTVELIAVELDALSSGPRLSVPIAASRTSGGPVDGSQDLALGSWKCGGAVSEGSAVTSCSIVLLISFLQYRAVADPISFL